MSKTSIIEKKNRFNARIFVSFGLFLSFVASATSGIVLFLRPEGSLASWTGWNVLGIDKKGWEGLHIASIAMLVLFTAAHLRFNWKVLVAYIRRRTSDKRRLRIERVAALLVVTLVLAGAVMRLNPVWKAVDLRTNLKNGVYLVEIQPPAPNAEQMPIADLCALIAVPAEEAISRLGRAGHRVDDPKTTLAGLAKKGRTTPEKLYAIILGRP